MDLGGEIKYWYNILIIVLFSDTVIAFIVPWDWTTAKVSVMTVLNSTIAGMSNL